MPSWSECPHGNSSPTACLQCREDVIRQRYTWKKVQVPRTWHPRDPGEELIGYFGGKTVRQGSFGQYEVALVHTVRGAIIVSGVRVIQQIDAGGFVLGNPIRVVWEGWQDMGNDKKMKLISVYVAEGEGLQPGDLPQVRVAQ